MKVCGHLKPLRIETRMQRLFSANTMASTATSAAQGPESGNQIHQKIAGRQRFYKVVGVKESADGKGFHVTLDGKVLKTPARHPLILPNRYLATLLACEWDFQTDKRRGIEPVSMPITQLVFTAIDQISLDPETTRKVCMSYLPTDTALFFAAEEDRILLGKQKQHLQPLVRWTQRTLGVHLETSNGHFSGRLGHPDTTTEKFSKILSLLDPIQLAAVQSVTMECKSLVMAIAHLLRHISAEQLKTLSRLEEEFQVEIWGVVEGGHDMDRLNNSLAVTAADTVLRLYIDEKSFKDLFSAIKE